MFEITVCLSLRKDSRESSLLVSSDSNLCVLASRTARSSSRLRTFIIVVSTNSVCRFADSVAEFSFSRRPCIFYNSRKKDDRVCDRNFNIALINITPRQKRRKPRIREFFFRFYKLPDGKMRNVTLREKQYILYEDVISRFEKFL